MNVDPKGNGSLIIGYDFSTSDTPILIIGQQVDNQMKILNAIDGQAATDLYKILTTEGERMKKAEKLADDILDFVNSFGVDSDTFAKTICKGHRTLQQSTMRLFMKTIEKLAENSTDDRNEATVELARKIVDISKDHPLPFV